MTSGRDALRIKPSDSHTAPTPEGVPQGGPLSPVLANVVLDELDWELERRNLRFGRLIQRLVLSLESPSEEELKSDWLLEARRRGEELDNGTVQAVSGEDVMRKARALIK